MNPTDTSARLDRLEGYLRQDPTNHALLTDAVEEALRVGAVARAEAMARSACSLEPSRPEPRHVLATVRLAQGQYDEAIELLEGIIEDGVGHAEVQFNLGYALFRAGRVLEAKQRFQAVLEDAQPPAATLAYLLRCLHHLGETDGAVEAWKGAPEEMRNPEARGAASLVFFDAHLLEEASTLAESALNAGARSAEANVTLAGIRLAQSLPSEAMTLLHSALALNGQDGRTWSTLGAACLMLRDVEKAQEAYGNATRFLPRHIGSWHGLAWCQVVRGDLASARESFERALAIDRNFGESYGGLAVVEALQGRLDEAEASTRRALRLDAGSLSARFAKAVMAGELKDRDTFDSFLMRSLQGRPGLSGGALLDLFRSTF